MSEGADPPPATTTRTALAAAAASGALWGLGHAVSARPLLAAVALVPLLAALSRSRRGFRLGWLFGAVSWCFAIPWIVPTLTDHGFVSGWLAGLGLLALAAFLGIYDAAFAALGSRLWRRGDALSLAALPALWVAIEGVRGIAFSGFPWNLAAYAWVDLPGALPMASWVGAWGVSYLIVLVNVLLATGIARRRWPPALLGLLLPLALLPIAARFGVVADPQQPPRLARIVQPNIPNRPFFDAEANVADYRRLLATSRLACEPGVLLLWPESAAWPRDWQDDVQLRLDVQALVQERGCSLLLNTAIAEGGRTYNSVLLVERSGDEPSRPAAWDAGRRAGVEGLALQRADKRHLVPFGEYMPLRRWLPFGGKIARRVGDFSPAEEIRLLAWRGERLGPAVCYEVVFPGETSALVAAGATVLVTVTNDGWYGDSAAPRQHLRAARFRAAENRRWLLRAAVTGISAAVRPDGSLAAAAGVGEERVLSVPFVGRNDRSPYRRAPWLVPLLTASLAAAALVRARRA